MNLKSKNRHIVDVAFILCLMLLFVLCAVAVISLGAGIYQKNVKSMKDNYNHRTACAYIIEKVRQSDVNGAIFVQDLFGQNALVIQEEIDGVLYNTYIYDYDGYLMELYARADLNTFYPMSGQKLLEVSSFDISQKSDSLFLADIVLSDGLKESVYIAKRSTGDN
ncbi:MAG: DUF4860 domain-containing protein [Butyrivibrio sp.]|uniref:DUF4860 domain-containing protein n=1 Tax=Butyrivibrio sp. TaxID=28121 RepID=UPI001B22A18F|nr:DUF4860 domain-containing protein [Butyrivibrio sp.]MBO6240399.1 DUF4860 domain-containing protein [Butyrivibrio sp.]